MQMTGADTFIVPKGLDRPGLVTRDLTFESLGGRISPFLVVSLFDMTGPVFPPHPHAGFSVATYIFPESEIGFWNQDTLGNVNPIAPGSLHLTVAGSGVIHEETVARSGRHARGFQIWIDHAAQHRQVAPRGVHLAAGDVPTIARDGVTRRVLLGASGGVASPVGLPTAAQLIDVEIGPGSRLTERLPSGQTGFIWVRSGAIETDGHEVAAGAVWFPDAGSVTATSKDGARLTLFAGPPMAETSLPSGPFVASTRAEADLFRARYAAGEMGALRPFDQTALDQDFDEDRQTNILTGLA